ncbi:aromatic acid exporter family protein [Streptomyces sp. 3211]|uniref:aromatic acid exporter family protein n=1 Tax=Streptomyces sp. 3211 TaxID=1964449 RepID=UPI00180C8B84|nr:aromatic acid exporter family protein [Streptomyces sp. 3211]
MRTAAAASGRYLRRAVAEPGRERDDLLLNAKCVVAAMVAWVLARYLLPPTVSTFAPFTALVALQATVYRSARDCAQYLLAMAAGTTLAATLAATVGIHGWSFGLLTLLGLWAGRVKHLGQQGAQVTIVGFFAFSAGQGRIDYVGHLAAAVTIGALCGLGAHLVLAPARHTGHRRQAVAHLCTGISRRISDLADTLESSEPDGERVRQWRRDWRSLAADCRSIQDSIDTEAENGRLNPRRSAADVSGNALARAREVADMAERSLDHMRSMTRAVDHALDGEIGRLPASFRPGFSAALRTAARAMEELGRADHTDTERLDGLIDEAEAELDRVQNESASTALRAQTLRGTLLTDAGRLLAELRSGQRALAPA